MLNWQKYLLAGSQDKRISLNDLRVSVPKVKRYLGHSAEVCSLDWAEAEYFASGGNGNKMLVWSIKTNKFLFKGEHKGGVRGLAWSKKKKNFLFSGGGQGDNTIKKWNVDNY